MSPYIDYSLTEEAYGRYESLLSDVGISVIPKCRNTTEDLKSDVVTMLSVHGVLRHGGNEFQYQLQRTQHAYRLGVNVAGQDAAAAESLMAALDRAFPQPMRPPTEQKARPQRMATVGATIGCWCISLCIIILVAAVCFFAVVGVRSLMK